MKNPLISIITLTYNNFNDLIPTIASVLSQNYANIEYIISDDGSDSFPRETVENFIKKNRKGNLSNFKLLLNKRNVGTVKHLNCAVKECNGEYIIILPGGDFFYDSNVLSKVYKIFEEENSDIIICARVTYAEDKVVDLIPHVKDRSRVMKLNTNKKMYSALMKTEHFDMFIGINIIYRKSTLLEKGCFDESYFLLEDIPILEKMLWNSKVSLKPDFISVFYDGKYGVSSKWLKNELLMKDIKHYNRYGRLSHFSELDKKTQNHIKFGIKREETNNPLVLAFLCLVYFPRIFGYIYFCLCRKISSFGDSKYIKENNLNSKLSSIKSIN